MIEQFIEKCMEQFKSHKDAWCYEDGCVLKGAYDLYEVTKEKKYYNFVLKYLEESIDDSGAIKGYNPEKYSIDDVNAGKVLFPFYEETKKEKYKKALEALYGQLLKHPRTKDNNFWHKKIYPNQVWLDGLYMAMPFYVKYEKTFNGKKQYKDVIDQFMNVRKYLWNEETELYYHGYDESRQEAWANKQTGVSPNYWGRAEGWFVMALADVLEEMKEEQTADVKQLENVFKEAVEGLLKYQDKETAMWYQVLDQGKREGNYVETSATLMIAYSFLKGHRLGILPENYKKAGLEAFESTVKKYLVRKEDEIILDGICGVAGLGNTPYRDGSYEYYISEKITPNDPKGVGAFLMTYSEVIRASKTM